MLLPLRIVIVLTMLGVVAPVRARGEVSSAPTKAAAQERTLILVNGRALAGPNSSAQSRGGRLLLPVATIAQALGDTLTADATARSVLVRRQTGISAEFNAQLNQVRENGSLVLTVSGSDDLVFPPITEELMLPAEIVSALLDVAVRRDEGRAIVVTRNIKAETVRSGATHASWELFQLEYDYNLNRYASFADHSLTLRGTGRVGDSRFTFLANTISGQTSRLPNLQSGTVRLDRPNGQSFVAGDFGTGTDLEFMSAAVRGGQAELPWGKVRLNIFGGRSASGLSETGLFSPLDSALQAELDRRRSGQLRYDINIFGAYASIGSDANSGRQGNVRLSAGGMHFSGPNRRGDLIAGNLRYYSARSRLQVDFGVGEFSGLNQNHDRAAGIGMAVNVTGSFQLTNQLLVQGRSVYISETFLSPQSGLHQPTRLNAAGLTWQPRPWLTAGLSASTATTPGRAGQFNRFVTGTLNIAARETLPAIFFSHTQSTTAQLKNSSFTLVNAIKDFHRWRLFVNSTRIKTFGPATLTAQAGANIRISESNSLQLSQSVANRGGLSGMASWQVANLFRDRVGLSGGLGYTRTETSSFRTSEHVSASIRLPRQTSVQFSYLQNETGPTLLLTLHGLLLSSRRAERAINSPLAEINSYGAVGGRVYQDVNLNGQFDPGTDRPQANVKVRVDGSRYVVSDVDGNFRIDNVIRGAHNVYLDLLSVRADLTLLDGGHQEIELSAKHDAIVDFRLVRTGRVNGVVWLDSNGNGRFDKDEQPLADIRVVTGSGRDTLTDANGSFLIGDLPPGEHITFLDEKTLPALTRSTAGSVTAIIVAGSETELLFPVANVPDDVKKFPRN